MSDGISDAHRDQNAYNKMRRLIRDFCQCLLDEGVGDGWPSSLSEETVRELNFELKKVGLKLRLRTRADWDLEKAQAAVAELERAR